MQDLPTLGRPRLPALRLQAAPSRRTFTGSRVPPAVVGINRVVKDTQVDVGGTELYVRQRVRACLRISQDPHLKTRRRSTGPDLSRRRWGARSPDRRDREGLSLGSAVPGSALA